MIPSCVSLSEDSSPSAPYAAWSEAAMDHFIRSKRDCIPCSPQFAIIYWQLKTISNGRVVLPQVSLLNRSSPGQCFGLTPFPRCAQSHKPFAHSWVSPYSSSINPTICRSYAKSVIRRVISPRETRVSTLFLPKPNL